MISSKDQESFNTSENLTSVNEKRKDEFSNVIISKAESSEGTSLSTEKFRYKQTLAEDPSNEGQSKGNPLNKDANENEAASIETSSQENQSKETALNKMPFKDNPLSDIPLKKTQMKKISLKETPLKYTPKKKSSKREPPKKETPKKDTLNDEIKQELPNAENPENNNSVLMTKNSISRVLDSDIVTAIMSLTTVYALYGDDVRIIAFEPSADGVFLILSAIAFFLFLTEIALLSWCKEKYIHMPNFAEIKNLFTIVRWQMRESTLTWLGDIWKAMQCTSFYFWLDLISTLSMVIEVRYLMMHCELYCTTPNPD